MLFKININIKLTNTFQSVHQNERRFECKICNKRFFYKTALDYHVRRHENKRDFVCTECDKSFAIISKF